MSKTEEILSNFNINKGTYNVIQSNLSQIGDNDLIITTDKVIPTPTSSDNGKYVGVENGDFALKNMPNIPSKTSDLTNDSGFVPSDNLRTINGNSLVVGQIKVVSSQNDLVVGKSYHIHIPAGQYPYPMYNYTFSSYSNLVTDIPVTTGSYSGTIMLGSYYYSSGSIVGFIKSSTEAYDLYNSPVSDFDVDVVYSAGTYSQNICKFMTYLSDDTNIEIPHVSSMVPAGNYVQVSYEGTNYNLYRTIPSNFKQVYNPDYANLSFGIYQTPNIYGTSSYTLNTSYFAHPGEYNFTISSSSIAAYGCPYTPTVTRRAYIITIGDYGYSSNYGGYRAIQDFYAPEDNKHYQRIVTKTGSSFTYGNWKDMNAGGSLYKHSISFKLTISGTTYTLQGEYVNSSATAFTSSSVIPNLVYGTSTSYILPYKAICNCSSGYANGILITNSGNTTISMLTISEFTDTVTSL